MSHIFKSVRVLVALALVLSLGIALVPVVKVTPALAQPDTYYVNASTGNDARNTTEAQNPATPWKTITHALTQVFAGDEIEVAAGLYDNSNNGESFPLIIDFSLHSFRSFFRLLHGFFSEIFFLMRFFCLLVNGDTATF